MKKKLESYYYPKLRGKRNELGYTLEDMANHLGTSKNSYFRKEKGYADFYLWEVRKILELLDSSYEDIFLTKMSTK